MTTILGFKDSAGDVAIAGDSVFNNGIVRYDGIEKIRNFGEIVAGFSGPSHSHRFRGNYEPTQIEDFADEFRAFQIDAGHARLSADMKETASTAVALTQAYRGASWRLPRLYLISNDGGAMEVDRYVACGSGAEVAFGALHALSSLWPDIPADLAVKLAIGASVKHDAWTGGQITIWSDVGRRRIEPLDWEEIAALRLPIFRARKAGPTRRRRVPSEGADPSPEVIMSGNDKSGTKGNDSNTTGEVSKPAETKTTTTTTTHTASERSPQPDPQGTGKELSKLHDTVREQGTETGGEPAIPEVSEQKK